MKSGYGFKTSKERSKLMAKIKSKDTRPELVLRKLLWNAGLRYRKNLKKLPGSPDLVIQKYKVAIFIDGEFWHGYNWEEKKERIKSNKEYWIPKIERNMVRDREASQQLEYLGYTVLRFWQHEIEKNPALCLTRVIEACESENN